MKNKSQQGQLKVACCGIALFTATAFSVMTGCQTTIGGTPASPSQHRDNIKIFPKGPEFKLQKEAEALRDKQEVEEIDDTKSAK